MTGPPLFGAIEAGGTKFVCLVGSGPEDMRAETRFPTTTPDATIRHAVEFLRAEQGRQGPLAAVGIASFGPVDLHPRSPTYGFITSTPKPGWANVNIAGAARAALDVPVGFDTDVNAAGLAEWRWGAARGLDSVLYLTVGTGIGGGGLMDGRLLHGLVHPEMGHIRIPHDLNADPFPGACPFHGDCLEGLASGPAIERRTGRPASEIGDDDPAWPFVVDALGHAFANLRLTLASEAIVIGGGVAVARPWLAAALAKRSDEVLAGYLPERSLVLPAALGAEAGPRGALLLAEAALASMAPASGTAT